ncbi:MAG: hypothetical protein ACFFDN_30190 [Candidatus Hodarchaeota archaeon]
MKPPICEICDKKMGEFDDCGLVYFKKRPSDLEWDKKAEQPGFVGHPPYAAWFCKEHYEQAIKLEHLTISEALQKIKEKT